MEDKAKVQTIVPPDWAGLANLSHTVSQLSGERCVKDLQKLFTHIQGLETKIGQQERNDEAHKEEAVRAADEIRRLREEHQARQEELIESNARLLRKKDDEKTALKQALSRQEDDLRSVAKQIHELKEENRECREQIDAQDIETKKIEAQLREVRIELERVQKLLKQHEAQIKTKDHDLQAEKKAHARSKADASAVRMQATELQAALKSSTDAVKQIEDLAPALVDASHADASKAMQKLWKQCVQLVQACFRDANPEEQLKNPTNWHALSSSHLITHALPLPPTNSHPARRMRLFAVLTILADELARQIFTSSYLFDGAGDLEKLMLDLASASQLKESLFRRIVNSVSVDSNEGLIKDRVSKVQACVVRCIEPLLSAAQAAKLKQDLMQMLMTAAELWCSLRQQRYYFAVEPESPAETACAWTSLVWSDDKKSFSEETVKPTSGVVSVLFPRILMVKDEKEQEIFSGVVLTKSETKQAAEELHQMSVHVSVPARGGSLRSNTRRRATLDQPSEKASFLSQNGSSGL